MKYTVRKQILHKVMETIPGRFTDDIMKRQLAHEMIEKVPIEMLDALFKFKKLDPESKESKEKMFNPMACDYAMRDYIIHLHEIQCVEFDLELDLELKLIPNK